MKSRRWILVLGIVLVTGLVPAVAAWWAPGHRILDALAFRLLAADVPAFFKEGRETIGFYAAEPDMWTEFKPSALRDAERAEHFCDLELLREEALPAARADFYFLCSRLHVSTDRVGRLPYAISEWYERLMIAFAHYRQAPDDVRVQNKIYYIAAILSHYAADATQPLHTTIHYDGRVAADGSSPRSGIHLQVDALFGRIRPDAAALPGKTGTVGTDAVFKTAVAAIETSHALVDRVYELEPLLPPVEGPLANPLDPQVTAFAQERAAAAAGFIALLWNSAWKNSADLEVPGWY